MINFYKNVSIAGAFLLLAITGPGAISSTAVNQADKKGRKRPFLLQR
jgi:uncharacterized membrane protein YphA (DoxX/SURF4 family)